MDMKNYLKENKIKITKARLSILEKLIKANNPLTAEEIYKELEGLYDLSTIYRTLEMFEEKNIVIKLNLDDNKFCFKIKDTKHKHILRCSLCDREIEIDCPMIQVKEYIKSKTGFTMMEHEYIIDGVCEECSKKKGDK
ncbi:MAG: Fur family transcriptional regulator [Clostridiaceae bacterium]